MKLAYIDKAISAICPIYGVDSSGGISFKPSATEQQIAAANALMAEYVGSIGQPDVVEVLADAVQSHLDAAAKAKNYDNIVSACSYAAAPNAFQTESIAFLEWRAACWAYCYSVMAEVQSQARAVPTSEQLVSELPILVLP